MARSSLNVLHISDLHFGTTDNARTWYAKLAEDLRYELACSRLDAVVISGDIASKSNPDEYAAAQLFVNRLSQEFQLEPHQIVIVPGNHDINWQISEAAYFRITTENSQQGSEEYLTDEQGRFIGGTNPEQHKQRFINFSKFYEAIRGEVYPLDYEQQYTLQHLPEQKLLILGLNSAWQIDHINKRNLSINAEALSNALSLIRTNTAYEKCLKIAVWHHSLNSTFGDRITDSGVMERLAAAGFRFILHGSVHISDNSSYHYDYKVDEKQIDIIGAGVFGISQEQQLSNYPWQYNFLKIEENKVTIETRKRDEVNGVWKPDTRWRQDSTEQLVSHHVIVLNQNNIQDYQLYFERGSTYTESGRYEQAIASFDKAIELNPDFHDAWNNRGLALLNLERYEQAIASFKKAIELKSDFHEAWNNQGLVLLNSRDYVEAIAFFDKAIELKPDFYHAWNNRGLALLNLERYEDAIASCDQALKLKPDFENALFNRGTGFLRSDRYEEAINSFQQSVNISREINNHNLEARSLGSLGQVYYHLEQYEQAIEYYQQSLTILRQIGNRIFEADILSNLGKVYYHLEQYQQAIRYYQQSLTISREIGNLALDADTLSNLGKVYYHLEQHEQAIRYYQQSLTISREIGNLALDADTLSNLGKVYYHLEQHEQAIQYYQQSLTISRKILNTSLEAHCLNNLGKVYYHLEQHEQAIQYYQQSLTISRKNGDLLWKVANLSCLGNAYKSLEQWERAIDCYEQSLVISREINDKNWEAVCLQDLGVTYQSLEEYQKAKEYLEQCYRLSEDLEDRSTSTDCIQRIEAISKQQELLEQNINTSTLENIFTYQIFVDTSKSLITIGGEIEISIYLGKAQATSDDYLLQIDQNEATGNELNIFLTAPGFHFNNDNTTSLPLDPDTANITQTATFNLTALRPGKTKIQAELYVSETYKTTLETEVEVNAFEQTQLRPLIAARSRPVPQPSLILQVQTTWNADISACIFNYHIDSYQSRLLFADNFDCASQSLSAIWVERTQQLLKATLEDTANSQPGDFRSRLASFGQYLFQSLFPEELQSTFRTIANLNHPFTLLIIADQDAWFPWELFHDGKKFLGDRLIIGRWLWELEKARPYEFPVGAVNIAHYANVEQPELWNQLLYSSGTPPPISMQAGIFNDMNLFESIRGLHLIRYGQSGDAENRQDAPVRIDNDNDIGEIEREVQPAKLSLRRNHPLVSLSYVNAGQMELTALEQTWASTFVRAGCSAFVGSLWAVQPDVEAAFINSFYNSLWAGASLGEAFYTSRQLARAVAPDSLDWLAYVLFGDPMARPYLPVEGKGYAVVEPIGREIEDPLPPNVPIRFRLSLRRTPPVWHQERVIEVAENLTFENLQVHVKTMGLQVTPDSPIEMNLAPNGNYLGWFTLVAPPEMVDNSALVQVYFMDGEIPIHSLMFSLTIENNGGE